MNDEPWWAYADDDAWKSSDGSVVVRAISSSRQAVTVEINAATGMARAVWDPQVQMLSMIGDEKLEKPTFAAVREYVASAAELHELSEPTQFVLDFVADSLSRDPLVSLKLVRQQLIRKYGVDREQATTVVERMHPRFVALRGDYVTLQPLGLLRSKLADDSKAVITRCLEFMRAAYEENADVSTIGLEAAFGEVDEDRKRLLLREIHLFKLASDVSTDGKGTWHVPTDIEDLWAENVTTLEALWRFVKEERKVPRPWPGALVRADWKDDRIEKYLEESLLRGSAASLVSVARSPAENAAPVPLLPEYKLPRLEVSYGEKLGSGAFGTVWQGTDKLLDRSIAVKFLTSTAESLDEEALIREARSLAKIAHPNLVTVYSAAWLRHPDNGLVAPAITMELLSGIDLEKWRDQQHERDDVLKVASGILAGIAAMHDAGLHHGDLHWQNVMVLDDATAKLIDWRYQDTFLQRSTAYRRDLVEADKRRAVDLVLGTFEKQGLSEEAMQLRKTPDFASVQAAVAMLLDPPRGAETPSPLVPGVSPQNGANTDSGTVPVVAERSYEQELATWEKTLIGRRALWHQARPQFGSFSFEVTPYAILKTMSDHAALRKLVQQCSVQGAGLTLPNASPDQFTKIQNRPNAIEGSMDLEDYQEVWQLHSTGAFMYASLLHYLKETEPPLLPFEVIIWDVALALMFSRRLYSEVGVEQFAYRFSFDGIKDQRLSSLDRAGLRLHGDYRTVEDSIAQTGECRLSELNTRLRSLVFDIVKPIFTLFNWDISEVAVQQRMDVLEGKR